MHTNIVAAIALVCVAACNPPLVAAGDRADAGTAPRSDAATETAIDAAISIDAPAAVIGCATAPVIEGSGQVTSWTRQTGTITVNYYGDGNYNVDITDFDQVWDPIVPTAPWPGRYGQLADIPLTIDKYVSAEFTVPVGYFETQAQPLYGNYSVGESNASAAVAMTISEHCGDFGQLAPTTIVPACIKNELDPDGALWWTGGAGATGCVLEEGKTYYLNIIDADISAFPATTTLRTKLCQGDVCTTPILNGFGTWTNPGA
ncbi:MAG TPA: hypothetical protein VH143_35745 [Kofleriaceae bacterium]|nr:hypothetical protein [Kofleriaceae bacterium]